MQLMTYVVPTFEQLKKEGEAGRRKITQYTRMALWALALFQSLGIAVALESSAGLVLSPGFGFRLTAVVSLTAGTMFLMWLGEQITERGLGNGISILIFAGIAAGLAQLDWWFAGTGRTGAMSIPAAIFIVAGGGSGNILRCVRGARSAQDSRELCPSSGGEQGLRRSVVASAPEVEHGRRDSSDLCIVDHLLPATVVNWFSAGDSMRWLKDISGTLTPGQPIYVMFYAAAIIFFCFFYTALVFNSRETADNLKKSGAFIPGIRPGEQTARYIDKILVRLTLAGAVYITFVCLLPEFLISSTTCRSTLVVHRC
jgi:preprotein translocase subunit SecY